MDYVSTARGSLCPSIVGREVGSDEQQPAARFGAAGPEVAENLCLARQRPERGPHTIASLQQRQDAMLRDKPASADTSSPLMMTISRGAGRASAVDQPWGMGRACSSDREGGSHSASCVRIPYEFSGLGDCMRQGPT
jgi:hypothetical protein